MGETLALIGSLDLFLSPDTGPMHMAIAVGTPVVALYAVATVQEETGLPGVIIEADMIDSRFFSEREADTRIDSFMEILRSRAK